MFMARNMASCQQTLCSRRSWWFYILIARKQKETVTLGLAWAYETSKPTPPNSANMYGSSTQIHELVCGGYSYSDYHSVVIIFWQLHIVILIMIFPHAPTPSRHISTFSPAQLHIYIYPHLKLAEFSFFLPTTNYSWVWDLPLKMANIPGVTPLKITVSSSSTYQMPVVL